MVVVFSRNFTFHVVAAKFYRPLALHFDPLTWMDPPCIFSRCDFFKLKAPNVFCSAMLPFAAKGTTTTGYIYMYYSPAISIFQDPFTCNCNAKDGQVPLNY